MTDVTTTSIPALDFSALAAEVERQPDLFRAIQGSVAEHQVIQAARERRYDGSKTPSAKAAAIVAMRASGASLTAIQRAVGSDFRTVCAVVRLAEEQGIVTGIKDVVARRMTELAERTMDVVERELESTEPDAQLIKAGWVGIGIAADKAAAAGTTAPQLHLHAHISGGDQDPAAIYAAMLRSTDAESAGGSRKPLSCNAAADRDTVLDIDPASIPDPSIGVGSGPGGSVSVADPSRDGGAGGVESAAPSVGGDGKP